MAPQGSGVDLRTNQRFTLKQNPLRYEHLQEFIAAYAADDRSKRIESARFEREDCQVG